MKRERKDETKGLCTLEPSQDIHGHHRDSGASRNPGESLLRAGFAVGEGVATQHNRNQAARLDEGKQADIEVLGDCLRALGDGQMLGDLSLTIVLYAEDKSTIDREIADFATVFTNADGSLFPETYNQLNALFATVPGNYAQNLRKMYMLLDNYADLSFFFTILQGEKHNPHLGTEYLAVMETDNATPYYLNLHNGEVAHTLILGMTGSGKSFLCNFLLTNAQKYKPLTYIFDIGGSFQSLTEIFGGSYLNVGQESRDFRINPFSLNPTKENLQFLFSFFRVLIEGTGQRYHLDFSFVSIGPNCGIEGPFVKFLIEDRSGRKTTWHLSGHVGRQKSIYQNSESKEPDLL
jgi:type IV secretory pathway VirB4 component